MVRRAKKRKKPKEIEIDFWVQIQSMLPKIGIPLTKADIKKARANLRKKKVDHD